MSYDMIDRFLRNNLGDDDYAEYSAALDALCTPQPKEPEQEPVAWMFEFPDKRLAPKFDSAPHGGNWQPLYKGKNT